MPRRKLSEFRAKTIINSLLGHDYKGWEIAPGGKKPSFGKTSRVVVKVDQAVKQRFKRGLIFLDIPTDAVQARVDELKEKGYSYFLVEPYSIHDNTEERYLSFRRERNGIVFSYSRHGGVEIESHADQIQSGVFDSLAIAKLSDETGLSEDNLKALRDAFDRFHMTLLEINPYIVTDGMPLVLDVAIEVDSSGESFTAEWAEDDFRNAETIITEEEKDVRVLNKESPASFNLEVINPDGSIFLLLSGGGASVVIADEIFTLGHGEQLANYGEYSGNPTREETKRYTGNVIELLLRSSASKKVVLVGGAVANFTDISATFEGIIDALERYAVPLSKQEVKFYVRRGGPRQQAGLKRIDEVLRERGLHGGVYDPSVTIPEAVSHMLEGVSDEN